MKRTLRNYQGVMEVKEDHEQDKNRDLPKNEHNTTRGKITKFSRKSRKRLFNIILKMEDRHGWYFITLTYPNEYPKNYEIWKHHLHKLSCSLRYHYPDLNFLWKLEFQKRGAPHFHLLGYFPTVSHLDELKDLILNSWLRIVNLSYRGLGNAVQVDSVKSIKSSGFYLAMYQTKDQNIPTDILIGRTWGIVGKKQMPIQAYKQSDLNEKQYIILKRLCRRWVAKQKYSKAYAKYLSNPTGSFQIFMPLGEQQRLIQFTVSYA